LLRWIPPHILSFKNKKDVWWLMLWLVIWFSLLSFVIYQLLVVCFPCKVILMNFHTFLLCVVSFVLHSWWVSSFPCYVSPSYYTFLLNFVAFLICIVSLLWVQSLASCVLPPCYALMEFSSIFFSCPSNHLWCSLSPPCCAPSMFFQDLSCSFSNSYLSLKNIYVETRRFFCNFFFNDQPKLQVICGHIKCWKNILYVFHLIFKK
jgi:hypothetical protein